MRIDLGLYTFILIMHVALVRNPGKTEIQNFFDLFRPGEFLPSEV